MTGQRPNQPPTPWLDRALAEDAQRAFLIVSGCIVFILGAFFLSLEDPVVAHELRAYSWPSRIEGLPVQLRAIGFDKRRHRYEAIGLCKDQKIASMVPPKPNSLSLPLLLKAPKDLKSFELCLRIPQWGERWLPLTLPTESSPEDLVQLNEVRDTEAFASNPYRLFPFAFMAVPAEGVFNPGNYTSELLLWLDGKDLKVRQHLSKEKIQDLEISEDGLFRIPIQNKGLIGQATVEVESNGKKYTRIFQFRPRARPAIIEASRNGQDLNFKVRLAQRKAPGPHAHSDTDSVTLYCSALLGDAAIASQKVELSAATPMVSHLFKIPEQLKELTSVICDPDPLGGDPDAVSTWALEEKSESTDPDLLNLIDTTLTGHLHRPMTQRIRKWYKSGDQSQRQRAKALLMAVLQPRPVRLNSLGSSFEADDKRVKESYESTRNRVFSVLVVLMLLWVCITIATLIHRRKIRTQAIADYLDDDPDEEVAASFMTAGKDALARPKSNLLALGLLGILLLHILGVLWVLWFL